MTAAATLPSHASEIRRLAREQPDFEGYVHLYQDGSSRAFSWAELDRRSGQIAGALAQQGVGFGDRVGLGLPNSPELVFSAFAAWKLGAVPVPVRWDLPDWEIARLREVVDAKVHLSVDDLPWLASTIDLDLPDLPELVSPYLQGVCSSGSTGTPKVILSQLPAVFDPIFTTPMVELLPPHPTIPRPQTVLVLAPMYHVNAFVTLNNLLAGDRIVVMEKFSAAQAVDAIEEHRVTTFTAAPTMLQRMADLPGVDGRDLSSLVWFIQGAAPMPPSLVRRWSDLIGAEKIVMAYGMTEALGITAIKGDEWMEHPGSVGRGFRNTELRILDSNGAELPIGEVGDVYMRNPAYGGSAYLGEVPKVRMTDDGFGTVGDMGYLDADGYLFLIDRRVDMIISGGANVFPAEVETALIDHPGIADVVVIGLEDPEWGRRVHAIVEPAPSEPTLTEAGVIAYAKSRLAAYKVPKSVELVEAIPRSGAGKANRGRLVEEREA